MDAETFRALAKEARDGKSPLSANDLYKIKCALMKHAENGSHQFGLICRREVREGVKTYMIDKGYAFLREVQYMDTAELFFE